MKPHACRIDRGYPQPQRDHATSQGKRNASETSSPSPDVVEHRNQQQREHQQQGHRHHDLQTLAGRLQLLQGCLPGRPVALQLLPCLRCCRWASATNEPMSGPHVGGHHHQALAVLRLIWFGPGRPFLAYFGQAVNETARSWH